MSERLIRPAWMRYLLELAQLVALHDPGGLHLPEREDDPVDALGAGPEAGDGVTDRAQRVQRAA
jgi:hypothetical protein